MVLLSATAQHRSFKVATVGVLSMSLMGVSLTAVSYTHLTLPTNREV